MVDTHLNRVFLCYQFIISIYVHYFFKTTSIEYKSTGLPENTLDKMLSWAIRIRRRMHSPSVKNEFSMRVIHEQKLTYVVLGGGYT